MYERELAVMESNRKAVTCSAAAHSVVADTDSVAPHPEGQAEISECK